MLGKEFYVGIAWTIVVLDTYSIDRYDDFKVSKSFIKRIIDEAGGIDCFENVGLDDLDIQILRKYFPTFHTDEKIIYGKGAVLKAEKLLYEVAKKYNWEIKEDKISKTFIGIEKEWLIEILRVIPHIILSIKINKEFRCITSTDNIPKDDRIIQVIYSLEIPELCDKIDTIKDFYHDIYIKF